MMKILIVIIGFFAAPAVFAGSIIRNGADQVMQAQAWFLGDALVEACVDVAADFPVDPEASFKITGDAINVWKMYAANKQLRTRWYTDAPPLDFNIELHKGCRGGERLAFYYGTDSEKIAANKKHFTSPRAFAVMETYDEQSGLGSGFVWVGKFSSVNSTFLPVREQLRALVMHEIGHLLGCDHVAGTIMREDLSTFMATATPMDLSPVEVDRFTAVIDHSRELFFSFDRGVRALAPMVLRPNGAQREAFGLLLDRWPEGELSMGFTQGAHPDEAKGQLLIGDRPTPDSRLRGRAVRLEFDPGTMVNFSSSDAKIFRVRYRGQLGQMDVPGFLIQGRMFTNGPMGERAVPVTYIRNRGDREYVRLLFSGKDGKTKEFFRAELFDQPYW